MITRQPTSEHDVTTQTPLDPHVLAAIAGAMQSENWHEMTFETPTRTPTTQGDVIVPLLQAAISGIYIGVIALLIAGALSVSRGWPWWVTPLVGITGWLVASGVVWSHLLTDSRRLLRKVERITRRDDNPVLSEPAATATTRLEVKLEKPGEGTQYLFQDLPVSGELFDRWARGVVGGRGLSQSAWTGKASPFSRSEYDALLAFMEKARVVRWSNPNAPAQGRELTRMGKSALESYVNRDPARAHAHAHHTPDPERDDRTGVGD